EAEGSWTGKQACLQSAQLVAVELARASCTAHSTQRRDAAGLPVVMPTTGRLPTHTQTTRNHRLRTPPREQASSLQPSRLPGRVILATQRIPFHDRDITSMRPFVTRFCKDQ